MVLQRLRDLDSTSPQFYKHLDNFLRGDEYRNAISNLQGEDLAQFVEYLSGVLVEVTDYKSREFLESLHELGQICAAKQVLPKSCIVSDSSLDIDPLSDGGVRILSPGLKTEKAKETAHRVAITWKNLAHPNIAPLLGVTTTLGFVSHCPSGRSILEYIKNCPGADRPGLISDVAEGLDFLHSCNVVHGGLNEATILVDATGSARITDVGLATIDGRGTYNKEEDIFAFAMVVIAVFTDTALFNEDSSRAVALGGAEGRRPPRPTHPTFTDELWVLTQRCWDHEAGLRPKSSEVLRVLRGFGPPMWKRLINHPRFTRECIPLITTILLAGSTDVVKMVKKLCKDDAQTFIDRVDEALDFPGFAPSLRRKCLTSLCRICGELGVLPGSLRIPQCYERQGAPPARGGCSDVWKGNHQGREVAVKVLKIYSDTDLKKVSLRFCKEVMTWKVLDHPNVMPLMGVTMDARQFAMVSEWMVNGNINKYIVAHSEANRFELLQDVARGLIYMHGRSMIHGDLKGVNILIDEAGHARLADFGVLTILSDPQYHTNTSSSSARAGTMRWMSPELFDPEETSSKSSKKKPTKESDCYALGMTTYEVLSGKVPFACHSNLTTMQKVLKGKRPGRPTGMERAWFTDDLWGMLKLSWATQPTNRPTIGAMLECFVQGSNTWKLPSPQMVEEDSEEALEDVEMSGGFLEGEGVGSDEGPEADEDLGPDEDTDRGGGSGKDPGQG